MDEKVCKEGVTESMSVSVISKPVSAFWKLPYPLLPQRAGLSAVQLTATTAAGIDNPVGTMNQTACICPRYLVVGGENTDDFFLYALALLITQNLASNPNASITHDMAEFISANHFQIPILEYLCQIRHIAQCTNECLVLSWIYIVRMTQFCQGFHVCIHNIHQLLITAALLATKFFEDGYSSSKDYATAGNVSKAKLYALEFKFLSLIQYSLFVSQAEYNSYRRDILAAGNSGSLRRCHCQPLLPTWSSQNLDQALSTVPTVFTRVKPQTETQAERGDTHHNGLQHCGFAAPGAGPTPCCALAKRHDVYQENAIHIEHFHIPQTHNGKFSSTVPAAHSAANRTAADRCCRFCRAETSYYCCSSSSNAWEGTQQQRPLHLPLYNTATPANTNALCADEGMRYYVVPGETAPPSFSSIPHIAEPEALANNVTAFPSMRAKRLANTALHPLQAQYDPKHFHCNETVTTSGTLADHIWQSSDSSSSSTSSCCKWYENESLSQSYTTTASSEPQTSDFAFSQASSMVPRRPRHCSFVSQTPCNYIHSIPQSRSKDVKFLMEVANDAKWTRYRSASTGQVQLLNQLQNSIIASDNSAAFPITVVAQPCYIKITGRPTAFSDVVSSSTSCCAKLVQLEQQNAPRVGSSVIDCTSHKRPELIGTTQEVPVNAYKAVSNYFAYPRCPAPTVLASSSMPCQMRPTLSWTPVICSCTPSQLLEQTAVRFPA